MRSASALLAVLCLLGAGAAATQSAPSLEGEWAGGFRLADSSRYLDLHWAGTPASPQLILDLPLERRGGIPVRVVRRDAAGVRLEADLGDRTIALEGRWTADGLEGTVTSGADRAPFTLLHLARPDPVRFAELGGNFETGPGHTISIAQIQDVMDLPVFYDQVTRRTGLLFPLSDSVYISGASLGVTWPVAVRATVVRDRAGAVSGLRWEEPGRTPVIARLRRDQRREAVTIRSGDVTLAGTLWLPAGPGPHPVVVNVMGPSGGGTRNLGETAPFFVSQGVAFLEYDKRGAGQSTGERRSATMENLALDARAALGYLEGRGDIDRRRLGLWGTSNGAWVVPIAAAAPSPVRFVIVRSAPILSANENVLYEVERDLRSMQFTEAEVQRGLALRRMLAEAVSRGAGWEALAVAIRSEANDRLLDASRTPRAMANQLVPLDSAWYRQFQNAMMHDPAPYWKRVTVPLLAFIGGRDASVPAERTRALFERVMRESGNPNVTIRLLPTANHIMFETAANDPYLGAHRDTSPLNAYSVAGYHDGIAAWLKANVLAPARP